MLMQPEAGSSFQINDPIYFAQQIDTVANDIVSQKQINQDTLSHIDGIIQTIEKNSINSPQVTASMENLLRNIKAINSNQPSAEGSTLINKIEKLAIFALA